MPITSSAQKALRVDRRRTQINRVMRSKLKTVLDKTNTQADADSLKLAYSTIDRAAKKRIIHKNKAARLKSALAHQVQSSTPQVKTPAPTKKASSKKTSKSSKK